ncbi:MAG: heparinase II/III family protein [Clostridia bacterium]|nr:heparinase II/III family protein [Clostridia bacterium]
MRQFNNIVIKIISTLLSLVLSITSFPLFSSANAASLDEYTAIKNVIWDIDFEDETLNTASLPRVTVCDAKGNALKNSRGDSFSCHVGDGTKSSLSIEDGSLVFEPGNFDEQNKTTDKVQTNEFYATVTENVAVYKYKIKVDDFNSMKYLFRQIYVSNDNNTYWSPSIVMNKSTDDSSVISVANGTDKATIDHITDFECQTNTWYNVDVRIRIADGFFSYRIDGFEIAAGKLGKNIVSTQRVSVKPCSYDVTHPSKLYLDDIYVYEGINSLDEYTVSKNVIWDIDFEDETLNTASLPYVTVCDANGNALKSSRGDSFFCHVGDGTKSSLSVEEGSLVFEPGNFDEQNKTTDKVQTNGFYATVTENVAVYKYKIKVDDFNSLKYLFRQIYVSNDNNTYWSPSIVMNKSIGDTSVISVAKGTDKATIDHITAFECKKNTWYNIDARIRISDGDFSYRIDGVEIAVGKLGNPIVSTQRVSIKPCSYDVTHPSKLYLDDIYVYEGINTPFASLDVYIDGQKATAIREGELCVGAVLSERLSDVDCVLAHYKGNELVAVKLVKNAVSAVSTNTVISPQYLGYADYSSKVKLFLLDSKAFPRPISATVTMDALGGEEMLDIDNEKTIFESEEVQKALLSSNIGYHPDSGMWLEDGKKENTGIKGEYCGDILMVPAVLFEKLGIATDINIAAFCATIGNMVLYTGKDIGNIGGEDYSLDAVCYTKDDTFYVPFKSVLRFVSDKSVFTTQGGINDGAVIISDREFNPGSADIQKLNYYMLFERPNKEKVLADYNASSLKGVHPRVIMTDADFERVKNETEPKFVSVRNRVIAYADSFLKKDELIYELRDGVRLWYVSMDFMDRVMSLAFAYKLTGNKAYFDKCVAEMDSVAAFPNWHPEHHIDVGGLAVGFAIGYDWLYDSLSENQRKKYEAAVYNLCYKEYYKAFTDNSDDMKSGVISANNHNSVMNSGITMCALSFMDVYPELGAYFISNSVRATENTVPNFYPDGSWHEGVGYGLMTLEYLSLQLSSLDTVLGTTYGLDASEGMDKAAHYALNMQCPTGAFAFYDGSSTSLQWHSGALWFAEYFNAPDVTSHWHDFYRVGETARGYASCLMYYNPQSLGAEITLPKDVLYSENEIVTARDSWTDNSPTFFGAKGGFAADAHGHMDMGTFSFFSDGVSWLCDNGTEDYNLPDFWQGGTREGARWRYFANRAEAHNCLIINPDQYGEYDPLAMAEFTSYTSNDTGVIAVLDMTAVHNGKAQSAKRGYFLTDNRQSLVVRDEVTVSEHSDIYFFLQTEHNVLINENIVTLIDSNNSSKTLKVEFACDAEFVLTKGDAVPLPTSPSPEGIKSTVGTTRIMLKAKATDSVSITVKFTPCNVNGSLISDYDKPISQWTF